MPLPYPDDQLPHPMMERALPTEPQSTVTMMETGRPRVRREFYEPRELMEVSWNFTGEQFHYFKIFYEIDLAGGTESFYLTSNDGDDLVTREVAFLDEPELEHSDNLYRITAVLEIIQEES